MRRKAQDPTKFFTRGAVSVLVEDRESRQAQFRVTAPACVLQAAFPQILAAGLVDGYEIATPLGAWVPTVADEGFHSDNPELPARINAAARAAAKAALDLFSNSQPHMRFPGDLVPVLPMGVYVTFRLRCPVDELVRLLPAMAPVAGVAELRFALAAAAARLLAKWGPAPPQLPSA